DQADQGGTQDHALGGDLDHDPDGDWVRHAEGLLTVVEPTADAGLGAWPPADAVEADLAGWYDALAGHGMTYGPVFQGLRRAWTAGDDTVYAEVTLPEATADGSAGFGVHPALLDAALHPTALLPGDGTTGPKAPFAFAGVQVHAVGADTLRVRLTRAGTAVRLLAVDDTDRPVVTVDSLVLREMTGGDPSAATLAARSLFRVDWRPEPLAPADAPRAALLGPAAPALPGVPAHPGVAELAATGDVPPLVLLPVPATPAGLPADALPAAVRAGTADVLAAVQAWLAADALADTRLAVVTRGAVRATDADPADELTGAAVWGLLRAAQSEHPGRIVLADLDRDLDAPAVALLAAAADDPAAAQLAVRADTILTPRLVRADTPPAPARRPLGGTVLVTGGTGALGALLARHLVTDRGVDSLALVSRRGPAADGAADLAAELTALGATVTVAAADVADRAAVARLVAAVPAERPLTAVVHLAGVLDDGVVTALTPDRLDTVFAPKVDAARHLDEATRHLDLAGFVLFSSGAGVFGVPGQGNYAAANAYLDALATRRRGAGLPAQSYAWGLWEQASAMTAKLDRADPRITARDGQLAIGTDLGMALFDAGLAAPEEHLVPTRVDVTALAGRATVPALMRGLVRRVRPRARAEAATGGRDLADRLRALTAGEQSALLLDLVRAEAATVLGHASPDAVKPAQAFNEIGFDSLTAVELRNRLTEATGHRLPATAIFDYPDPTALAGFLRAQLVPDAGQAAPAILAELENLERSLAETVVEAELHTQVAARLEVLVAKWRTMRGASATDHDLDLDLDQASDDEIFSLIDTELGL
ncbi:type I polyketide synthase, partial [Micromonospora carbonacea]|uniref:type I polyketide synthase n=1 Tax=Micromonospora carbonacea TaxID=47853 RepID=UPI003401D4BE